MHRILDLVHLDKHCLFKLIRYISNLVMILYDDFISILSGSLVLQIILSICTHWNARDRF